MKKSSEKGWQIEFAFLVYLLIPKSKQFNWNWRLLRSVRLLRHKIQVVYPSASFKVKSHKRNHEFRWSCKYLNWEKTDCKATLLDNPTANHRILQYFWVWLIIENIWIWDRERWKKVHNQKKSWKSANWYLII